jgi:competence protein ComEA
MNCMKKLVSKRHLILVAVLDCLLAALVYTYNAGLQADVGVIFRVLVPSSSHVVYISGAVRNPGVYELGTDTRIFQLVDLAGGFSEEADLEAVNEELNLSKIALDGEHITIPFRVKQLAEAKEVANSTATSHVSLNTASLEELDLLPGVGLATAEKIIANRPFTTVEGLLDVPGIGASKFADLKDLVSL